MLTLELRERVRAEVTRLWGVARARYPDLNYHAAPDVYFDVRGTKAGLACHPSAKRGPHYSVRFNPILLTENVEEFFTRTIPHEVAHIVDFIAYRKSGHGPTWRTACAALGMKDITRCHRYDVRNAAVRARREVSCRCEGTRTVSITIYNRMMRGSRYKCGLCKSFLSEKKVEFSSCVPAQPC